MILLVIFYIGEAACEHYKPKYGHHTCLVVIFGIILSLICYAFTGAVDAERDVETIFLFFVPLLVFNSGFNLRTKRFF